MRKIWPFSLNFLLFAGVAFSMPFMVLYYQNLGFSGTQIGILVGLTPLITLFGAPLWTGLADSTHRHRFLMSLAMLCGAAAIFFLPFFRTFAPVIFIIVLFNLFFAPVSAFSDSATMYMLADQKEMYGRIRLGGTIGFGLAATIAGLLVQNYGLKFAFWGSGILFFLGFIVSQKLVFNPLKGSVSSRAGFVILIKNRRWVLFLTLAFAAGLAFAVVNNYMFPYMKSLGANEGTMGLALTIGTLSEVPVLFFGNWLLKRFRSRQLIVFAMVFTGIRLIALSVSNTPNLVLFIQLLNGPTFSALWMAGVSYADEYAPPGMSATAQGLFGAMVFGFGSAVGGFAGGLLLEYLGGHGMYMAFGLTVLATVTVVALIEARMPLETQAIPDVV